PALNVQAAPATQTGASAEADSGWTLVQASEWRTRAPGLIGRRVELSGDLSTQFYVDPGESFSNTGEMRGTSWRDPLATVLFDQGARRQQAVAAARRCPEQGRHVCGCHGRSGGANAGHGQEEEGRLAGQAQGHGLRRDSGLRA